MSSSVDALPLVDRPRFNMVMGAVIMVNAVVIEDETDHLEQDAEFKDRVFPWYVLENSFCVVRIFEMFSRMHYHPPWNCRHGYFTDPWNVLDFFLVMLSVVDAYGLGPMEALGLTSGMDLSMLGALRMVRMLRPVRLVRLLRMFRELWLTVHGFRPSLKTLSRHIKLLTLLIHLPGVLE